jgi:hypothetical protein
MSHRSPDGKPWLRRSGSLALLLALAGAAAQPAPRLMVQSGRLATAGVFAGAEQLALAPNAQLLASAAPESVRIWHTATGRLLCELRLDGVQRARREAAAALAQAREVQAARAENRSPRRLPASQAEPEDSFTPAAFAWSADATTLYGAWPGLPLQRWDIAGCRPAGTLPFSEGAGNETADASPRQLLSLADGRLLANSPAGVFRLRVRGDKLESEVLADRERLRAASRAAMAEAAPAGDTARPSGLAALRALAGSAAQQLQQAAADALGRTLLAASADGKVVLLGTPAETQVLAAVGVGDLKLSPLLVLPDQVLTLEKMAGARASYAGASLGAISSSGRWLALRSDAEGGVRLSLFDLPARRLAQEVVLPRPPAASADAEAMPAFLNRLWNRNAVNSPLSGLAFSPDERQLVLFRDRGDGAAATADSGPVLELRPLAALATVQRRVPLLGSVLPAADLTALMLPARGNKLVAAAGGQAFAFQAQRLMGQATTLSTATWQDGLPLLRSWSPGEGRVDQLVFSDDEHLFSTHSAPLAPGQPLQQLLPAMTVAGRPIDPAAGTQMLDRLAGAANALQRSVQVMRWSLDNGQVERLQQGRAVFNESLSPASTMDPLRQRQLQFTVRPDPSAPEGFINDLIQRPFDESAPGWQRPMVDAQGRRFTLERAVYSPDGRWLAAVVKPQAGDGVRVTTSAGSGGAGRAVADRVRPDVAERLRDVFRGLRGGKPAAPAEKPTAETPPSPPSPPAPAADLWLAGRGEEPSLVLVDADNGQALATLAISGSDADSKVLQFVAGRRLLLGQRLVEIEDRGGAPRLSMPYGLAYDGRLVGVTAQSGRPIVAGGHSAGSLRALRLPEAFQQAHLASSNADDHWLALAQDDRLTVLDVERGMRSVISLSLDGARVEALRFAPGGRLLAAGLSSGLIKLIDAPQARELATLMAAADGEWTVVDPQGRLDASNLGANSALHWVTADKPLQPLPFDALMRAFHTPDLLPRAVHGDAALASLPSMAGRQHSTPQVNIDAIEALPAASGTPPRVRLRVSVLAPREADGSPGSALDLRVLRNGRLVAFAPAADGPLPLDAATGRYSTAFDDVRLPEGDEPVHFQAYAFNRDGVRGDTATRSWRPPQPVRLGPGRAYVLAIGINRYDEPGFQTLEFAVNDAHLLTQALGDGLRRSGAWREVVTVTLESQPGGRNDATKARIAAALGVLAGQPGAAARLAGVPGAERLAAATPADLVMLAFAGHGYLSPNSGELQLVPSDVQPVPGAQSEGVFDRSTISTLELDRWLRPLDAGQLTIVIDACHSGAAVAQGFRGGPIGSRGLGQLASDKGARLLAATQAAEQAVEHQRLQHGLLTYALVKEGLVAGRADTRPADGRIDLLEWLRYAEQRLPQLQMELARNEPLPPVQGERGVGRGIVRPGASAPAPSAVTQRARLLDFVPPGHAEPVVGRVP